MGSRASYVSSPALERGLRSGMESRASYRILRFVRGWSPGRRIESSSPRGWSPYGRFVTLREGNLASHLDSGAVAPAVAAARLGDGRGPRSPGCPRTRRDRPLVLARAGDGSADRRRPVRWSGRFIDVLDSVPHDSWRWGRHVHALPAGASAWCEVRCALSAPAPRLADHVQAGGNGLAAHMHARSFRCARSRFDLGSVARSLSARDLAPRDTASFATLPP